MKKALLSLLLAVAVMPLALAQDNTQRTIITSNSTVCGSLEWIDGQTYTNDTVVYYINTGAVKPTPRQACIATPSLPPSVPVFVTASSTCR